jgi:hypothetical protein
MAMVFIERTGRRAAFVKKVTRLYKRLEFSAGRGARAGHVEVDAVQRDIGVYRCCDISAMSAAAQSAAAGVLLIEPLDGIGLTAASDASVTNPYDTVRASSAVSAFAASGICDTPDDAFSTVRSQAAAATTSTMAIGHQVRIFVFIIVLRAWGRADL